MSDGGQTGLNYQGMYEHAEIRIKELERQLRDSIDESRDLRMYKWAFQMLVKELREGNK